MHQASQRQQPVSVQERSERFYDISSASVEEDRVVLEFREVELSAEKSTSADGRREIRIDEEETETMVSFTLPSTAYHEYLVVETPVLYRRVSELVRPEGMVDVEWRAHVSPTTETRTPSSSGDGIPEPEPLALPPRISPRPDSEPSDAPAVSGEGSETYSTEEARAGEYPAEVETGHLGVPRSYMEPVLPEEPGRLSPPASGPDYTVDPAGLDGGQALSGLLEEAEEIEFRDSVAVARYDGDEDSSGVYTRIIGQVTSDILQGQGAVTMQEVLEYLGERGEVSTTIVDQPYFRPDRGEWQTTTWVLQWGEEMDQQRTEFLTGQPGDMGHDPESRIDETELYPGEWFEIRESEEYGCGMDETSYEVPQSVMDEWEEEYTWRDDNWERMAIAAVREGSVSGAPLDLSGRPEVRQAYIDAFGELPEDAANVTYNLGGEAVPDGGAYRATA